MHKVRVQIISIGDELLLGETINTNASFIARALRKIGILVEKVWTIADDPKQMKKTITQATTEADLVLTTGGLGPTNDDLTQKVFCELTKDKLIENIEVLEELKHRFEIRGRKDNWDINKQQALVPSKARIFINKNGTAPALWMEYNQSICIAMPGVPFEMKELLRNQIIPSIQENFPTEHIYYRTLLTYGIGESVLMHRLKDWEDALPKEVKLAYLPSYGKVRLRVLGTGRDKQSVKKEIKNYIEELKDLLPDAAVGVEEKTDLIEEIKEKMLAKKTTLSLAESCTGGFISKSITQKAGISSFFFGGVVTYATESKINILGIDPEIIAEHSVVSAPVAFAMAESVSKLYKTDYALATTGVAGPTKGDSTAEIGTVFIALKTPEEIKVVKKHFGKLRKTIINRATKEALTMLWKEI